MRHDFIYLDYNATTPVDPRVAEVMRPFLLGGFGNPSSLHKLGREARAVVEKARGQVASCLGCAAEEIVFTSGGSESNNMAIRGVVDARGGGHVITSAVEHPAVLEVVRALEREGRIRLTVVGVDRLGRVDPEEIEHALRPDTILVSVMLANNEVGTIEPVGEIVRRCRPRNVLVHTDAAQAVGKIPVNVRQLGVDLLSLAGHKLYAPKGVGALYVRRGVRLEPIIRGAGHEMGLRAGTENILEETGLGAACELIEKELEGEIPRLEGLRDRLEQLLVEGFEGLVIHGDPEHRLPNTLNVAFPGVDAGLLLTRLGEEVGASAGAACHADSVEPSHVLAAMGVGTAEAMSTVRFSVGRFTSEEEVEIGVRRVLAVATELAGELEQIPTGTEDGEVRLTRLTHGLGCACKLQPQVLEEVLKALPKPDRPEVLVGAENADDACAWRLEDGTVLVQTLDFFTPVVDEPRLFGAIAAANALSDIYAMGAKPLFALNIAAFPVATLRPSVLVEILAGAGEVAGEAGIPMLGGHTVEDTEPKFGWVVTGIATEESLWKNSGARPGNLLVLTKPVGTGIWSTAAKHGRADAEGWRRACAVMRQLNRRAAESLREAAPTAVTDVTGFGLIGHLHEMLAASGVDAQLWAGSVPVLPGTSRLAASGEVPGGTRSNLAFSAAWTAWDDGVPELDRIILADAQTSGGLLAAVPRATSSRLLAGMETREIESAIIGVITGWGTGRIQVTAGRSDLGLD
ncbi:MAG: selenide, water dikinase SelD [Acidobacteria bacterium]|nr:selenide, water dikinase SelD [Acidobacteriota bacterium]